jgi:hypothetical protein
MTVPYSVGALGNELRQQLDVFVVDAVDSFKAEFTDFFPAVVLLLPGRTFFLY